MTLCTAYIRKAEDAEELVFATDSCLSGGEVWKNGIKLFELPRKDALLCFTGRTFRAYPLVLNLISSINLDEYLQSPAATLTEVVTYLSELFTELVSKIISEVQGEDIHELRSGAIFLFGGWDWQSGRFKVWRLYYNGGLESFVFEEITPDDPSKRFYSFIGEAVNLDIEAEAKKRLKQLIFDEDRMDDPLDMEPLKILRDISLDPEIREVDGSLQIAKVHRSNRTEFFGVYWESSEGKPCFQGREYNEINKPVVRYFDPDTFEIFDSDLPQVLHDISPDIYGDDYQTVFDAYDEASGSIKSDIPEKTKHTLRRIFKDVAYRRFLQEQEDIQPSVEYAIEEEE